jgi:hypothetical protein
MATAVSTSLLALGLLTSVGAPMAVLTFRWWEPSLHRWLDRRRREQESLSHRRGIRRSR